MQKFSILFYICFYPSSYPSLPARKCERWWIKSDLFLSLTLFGLETDHLSIIEGRDRREGKLTTNCNIH